MNVRLAITITLCLPLLGLASARAAEPMPDVIAPADVPTIVAVRADSRSAQVVSRDSAPMPDADAAAPVPGGDDAPQVQPAFYANRQEYKGDGFSPGSSAQAVQDRSVKPAAGLALNVPLN